MGGCLRIPNSGSGSPLLQGLGALELTRGLVLGENGRGFLPSRSSPFEFPESGKPRPILPPRRRGAPLRPPPCNPPRYCLLTGRSRPQQLEPPRLARARRQVHRRARACEPGGCARAAAELPPSPPFWAPPCRPGRGRRPRRGRGSRRLPPRDPLPRHAALGVGGGNPRSGLAQAPSSQGRASKSPRMLKEPGGPSAAATPRRSFHRWGN